MTDIQHNISDDHIIKNTTDIGNDYKFSSHNISPSRPADLPGMVLFRLLQPGPSNLRGRTEAYQVTISTNQSTNPPSAPAIDPALKQAAISKIKNPVDAPIATEYAHIEEMTAETAPMGELPDFALEGIDFGIEDPADIDLGDEDDQNPGGGSSPMGY